MQISNNLDEAARVLLEAERLLITSKKDPRLDAVASLLALGGSLKNLGKKITLAIPEFVPAAFSNLSTASAIQSELTPKSLIVSIDLAGNPIDKINYESQDGKLNLIITPKQGNISAEAIEFRQTGLETDAIVTINVQKLEDLGRLYQDHAQSFMELPLVNIDNDPANTHYGKLNLVDQSSKILAQIVFELLKRIPAGILAEQASLLYTALVDKTGRFSENITADVFKMAAELLEKGADPKIPQPEVAIR